MMRIISNDGERFNIQDKPEVWCEHNKGRTHRVSVVVTRRDGVPVRRDVGGGWSHVANTENIRKHVRVAHKGRKGVVRGAMCREREALSEACINILCFQ